MDIDKKGRTELKAYFVKNAIPTENNFAELIDAALNQKDDGIVKLAGNPLSIEAAEGAVASEKKALNLYESFADTSPAWVLSLTSDAAATPLGFGVSDGAGNLRWFIDRSSGNVGIGTIAPGAKLHVEGGAEATLAGGGHLVLGSTASTNMVLDGDEIQARNNGAASNLSLQPHGGLTKVGSGGLSAAGRVGIGVSAPANTLDIASLRSGSNHPSGKTLYVTGDLQSGEGGGGVEFRYLDGSQGVGFSYNTIYATGSNVNQDLNLQARGTGVVRVQGDSRLVGDSPDGLKLGAFTSSNSDEWPLVTWLNDVGNQWQEGLIKHGTSKGRFGMQGFGIHFHEDRSFGFFSSSWDTLMELTGGPNGSEQVYVKGVVEAQNFNTRSSREIKRDISALSESDCRLVIEQLRQTPVFRYRFKQEGSERKPHLGVIAEECPGEILDETGKSVSLLDFAGFLLAAVKAQQAKIEDLQAAVDRLG